MFEKILKNYKTRKSYKEKTRFIEMIKKEYEEKGYEVTIETSERSLFKSRNIIIGSLDDAKVFLTAHYDTCALCPFPNVMAPTNPLLFIISQVTVVFLVYFVAAILVLPIAVITMNYDFYSSLYVILIFAICFQIGFGFKNPNNANDNTSGVLVLCELLNKLPEEERKKVCVVLFDNEEKGLLGSAAFKKKHKLLAETIPTFNFDCVGDGNNLITMVKRDLQKEDIYQTFKETFDKSNHFRVFHKKHNGIMFTSVQINFKNSVAICTLKKSLLIGKYCTRIHTPFDTKCNPDNINELSKLLCSFINRID